MTLESILGSMCWDERFKSMVLLENLEANIDVSNYTTNNQLLIQRVVSCQIPSMEIIEEESRVKVYLKQIRCLWQLDVAEIILNCCGK